MRWGIEAINDFRYRDRFKLSYSDFLEEPIEVYEANKFIMEQEAEIKHDQAKKAERQAKRRSRV